MNARFSGSIWRKSRGKKRFLFLALALAAYVLATAGGCLKQMEEDELGTSLRPLEDKIRVACIGDSITYGAGVKDRQKDAYPALLQEMLGDRYQVLNYGLPGKTLQREGSDPFTKNPHYQMSSDARPAVVVIMLGTNDAMPKNWNPFGYEQQLKEMVDAYLALESSPQVFIAIPPAAYCEEGKETALYRIPPERISGEIADAIRRVGEDKNVEVIDTNTPTSGHREWVPDGIHPNEEGSRVIAETVAQAIRRAETLQEEAQGRN